MCECEAEEEHCQNFPIENIMLDKDDSSDEEEEKQLPL